MIYDIIYTKKISYSGSNPGHTGPIVVYIILSHNNESILYIYSRVPHALTLSQLLYTCCSQTSHMLVPAQQSSQSMRDYVTHAMIFNLTYIFIDIRGVTMWINRWVCLHHMCIVSITRYGSHHLLLHDFQFICVLLTSVSP